MDVEPSKLVRDQWLEDKPSPPSQAITTMPMRYAEFSQVWATNRAARAADNLSSAYMRDIPDVSRLNLVMHHASTALMVARNIYLGRALTINGGDAVLFYRQPRCITVAEVISRRLSSLLLQMRSPEQRKRGNEIEIKINSEAKAAFGDRLRDMFTVFYVETHPEKRGRGYNSALMAAANAKADALGAPSWTLSSNSAKTALFESCGFVTVREFTLGDENPTWSNPPIIVKMMARNWQDGKGNVEMV